MQNKKYKDVNEASQKFFEFKLETLGKKELEGCSVITSNMISAKILH